MIAETNRLDRKFGNGIDCELKQVRLIDKECEREGQSRAWDWELGEWRIDRSIDRGREGKIDGRGQTKEGELHEKTRSERSGAAKRKTGNEEGN